MISACIASTPDRAEMLFETVQSLLPQVDKIYLFLNNYSKESAENLLIKINNRDKITTVIHDNSYGDAGKFYFANKLEGFVFTCDDDIIFPQGYIRRTISAIEQYGRKAVVSYHGRTMTFPIHSYYNGHERYFAFNKELRRDTPCHVIGTGCMAYHSSAIKVTMDDFPSKNMADVHFSILAQKKSIPLMVLAHKERWLVYMQPQNTIFKEMSKDDSEQVRRLNEISEWKIPALTKPEIRCAVILFHKNFDNYPEKWTNQCLNSIKNQTYKNFDVFEIDYGGTNRQVYEGSNFESMEFRTHAHAHNYLLDKVFSLGYDCAFNVNADDYYSLDRFEKQIPAMQQGWDVVSSNFYRVNQIGQLLKTFNVSAKNIIDEAKSGNNIIAHPSVCYSRKYWQNCDKLNPDEIPFDDFNLWKRSYNKGFKFFIVPEFLLYHRVHQDNISRKKS